MKLNNQEKTNNNINTNDDKEIIDKMDIEIEGTPNKLNTNENINLPENKNQEKVENNSEVNKAQNGNENQQIGLNNDIKGEEIKEESLRNWFSLDLVNNQRNKIKHLIGELSKIENEIGNKNDTERIRKEQNIVINKYMENQKKEFDEYFFKLKENNN